MSVSGLMAELPSPASFVSSLGPSRIGMCGRCQEPLLESGVQSKPLPCQAVRAVHLVLFHPGAVVGR